MSDPLNCTNPVGAWEQENQRFGRLIAQASAGNVEAFEELYTRSARWLLSHIRCLINDGQAEDVLAEVFLQIWKCLGSYDPRRASPAGWLVMIARSRALDHLRRENRHSPGRLDVLSGEVTEAAEAEQAEPPEQLLSRLQQRHLVQLALQGLSEQEQLLLGLAYFRDNSHTEIAAMTGLPLGTVKSMMSRAQEKLREQFTGAQPHDAGRTLQSMSAP